MIKFLVDYWNGKHSLAFSFWVVFLGLILVLSLFEPLVLEKLCDDPEQRIKATFISLLLTRLIIFPWQFVGLMRVVDNDFIKAHNTGKTRVIQAVMLLSVLFTPFYSIEVIQDAYVYKSGIELSKKFTAQAPSYVLHVIEQKQQLHIKGDFEVGITNAVADLLEKNQGIRSVLLESHGGQIYEGRGLLKLFTLHSLDTHVETYCSSACATAFIGGAKRSLANDAELGFHQYKLDSAVHKKSVPFHRADEEQTRDLELFQSRGISAGFLEKVFEKNPDQMWFPEHTELLEASVIHQLTE